MLMTAEIIEKIENSGFKKKYIAKKIGITPTYLHLCMTGQRTLSGRKEENLLKLLALTAA
jgi:hypothetical protein